MVDSYTLIADEGTAVTVWSFGATLIEVLVKDKHGRMTNVVKRLPDLASYENRAANPYIGCTMGRFCRCLGNGRFTLDGVTYYLSTNEGQHQFHGGPTGFDRRVWEPTVTARPGEVSVNFRHTSPDGDQGFPGEVRAEATYRLDETGLLTFEYSATSTAPTIISLTNHAFWNLGGSATIDDHILSINACQLIQAGEDLIPVPDPLRTVPGELNFTEPRQIGSRAIDNYFVLLDPSWAATLYHPASGRRMRVVTDQPGLGVYTGDWLSDQRAGLCLQASAWPDAPNIAIAPSARLDPGTRYYHRTTHEFLPAE